MSALGQKQTLDCRSSSRSVTTVTSLRIVRISEPVDHDAAARAAFNAAALLVDQGKTQEAEAAFARLAGEGTAGYRVLARLREAAVLAQRDPKAAVAAYDMIANDTSVTPAFRQIAGVRAAIVLVDSAPLSEITRRLEPLARS